MCECLRVCERACQQSVIIWKASLLTTTVDDVCVQQQLCPEMVSDSGEYACNEVETEEKLYVQTL